MASKYLGRADYVPVFKAMRQFTTTRDGQTDDELWLCEHPPVFTLGLAGKPEHLIAPGAIPVVMADRGGQVTYHGPGQVVVYAMVDLRRAGYYVKEFVYRVEEAVISTLNQLGVTGHRVAGAPGIYLRLDDPFSHAALTGPALAGDRFRGLGKIAALGIKVSHHCTYHGVALNVAMDLEPFSRINPCGYPGLAAVDLSTIGLMTTWNEAAAILSGKLAAHLAP